MVKNKVAPPFREANFDILYGEGISREGEIVELGTHEELMAKAGLYAHLYSMQFRNPEEELAAEIAKMHKEIPPQYEDKPEVTGGLMNLLNLK